MYTVIIVIFSIIVLLQLWYITKLRAALKTIYEECLRFQGILMHYDALIKQDEERFKNGSKDS